MEVSKPSHSCFARKATDGLWRPLTSIYRRQQSLLLFLVLHCIDKDWKPWTWFAQIGVSSLYWLITVHSSLHFTSSYQGSTCITACVHSSLGWLLSLIGTGYRASVLICWYLCPKKEGKNESAYPHSTSVMIFSRINFWFFCKIEQVQEPLGPTHRLDRTTKKSCTKKWLFLPD
jgi:hypothetical protein